MVICLKNMKTHTRVKSYECEQCGKAFRYLQYVERHLLTHSRERSHRAFEIMTQLILGETEVNVRREVKASFISNVPNCTQRLAVSLPNPFAHEATPIVEKHYKCNPMLKFVTLLFLCKIKDTFTLQRSLISLKHITRSQPGSALMIMQFSPQSDIVLTKDISPLRILY